MPDWLLFAFRGMRVLTMEKIIFRWLDKLLRLERLLELTGEDTYE